MPGVSDVLETLIPVVGEALVGKARDEISRLSEDADDPTKKVVLALMAEAVEELGESGLADATCSEGQLLLVHPLFSPCTPKQKSQLRRGADHLLTCSHGLRGFSINA